VKRSGPLLTAAALVSLLLPACETSCDIGSGEPIRFAGGELIGGFYQTSAWQGPLLYFPGDRRFDIAHGLGTRDIDVNVYLSFEERGTAEGKVKAAPAAGNQAVIEHVDEERVRVHNDSCAEFYLRLTAEARSPVADAGAD